MLGEDDLAVIGSSTEKRLSLSWGEGWGEGERALHLHRYGLRRWRENGLLSRTLSSKGGEGEDHHSSDALLQIRLNISGPVK